MNFKNNRLGFTLIELIVVIAIMGVILILALPQVSKLKSANKDKKYDAYYSSIENGAKLYIDSQAKDLFGSNSSGCVTVKYSDLKKQNLVKDFASSDVFCDKDDETYVEVRKANDNFLYSTSLVCHNRDNGKVVYKKREVPTESCTNEPDKAGPTVTITPSSYGWGQTKKLKIDIKVSDEYTLNKNVGILYYWTNSSGIKVSKDYTYNYKNKKGVKSVTYQIPTKNIPTDSGEYNLVVRQWISSSTSGIQDILGNQTVGDTTAGLYKIDNVKPTCGNSVGDKTTWSKDGFTINQYCNDDASGCTANPYSKAFTSSTKTYTFTIKDRADNTNTCKVNVYLDVDKPTCGKIVGESTSWINQNRKISVGCNDSGGSNCSQSSFEQIFFTDGKTDLITVSDVAGNTRSCPVDKYIDKTPPNCGSISGQSTTWTKDNRTISVKCNDALSGCSQDSFSNTFSSTTKTSNITIKDNANNTNSCLANVYVDKTAPSNIQISGNPGCVNQPTTIKLTLSANEKESGIAYWQYGYNNMNNMTTYSNSASSPFTTTPFSAVRNDKTYLRVCDKVGNCNYSTTQICIKNSKPDFGGNLGQWKVLYNPRSSCDYWAAHPYGGSCPSGIYGNTIGKLDASYSGHTFTFKWAIANGGETWISLSYYVNFVIKKNGNVIRTIQIKDPYGDAWLPGTTHEGTITETLSAGTYEILFEGNSFQPSYTASMGTIVVR